MTGKGLHLGKRVGWKPLLEVGILSPWHAGGVGHLSFFHDNLTPIQGGAGCCGWQDFKVVMRSIHNGSGVASGAQGGEGMGAGSWQISTVVCRNCGIFNVQ